jgi:hypothetical protein
VFELLRKRSRIIEANVLYHSLSRPKDDRKKNADAIEFCELGDGVSAIFTKKSNTGFADLGRTQT